MTDDNSKGVRVAFQGELGAYSEAAIRSYFEKDVEPIARRDFQAVGDAVLEGSVEFGLLPVENTLAGSVVGSYDVLGATDLAAIGEVISPIHHLVLGSPGSTLEKVQRILSHPVALAQCTRFLEDHPNIEAVSHYDTAGAAKEVAASGDPRIAAIAGAPAAERYGLTILADHAEDRSDNQTRFLVICRSDREPVRSEISLRTAHKTTLLLETENSPGALVNVLLPFADRGINLLKLESRPGRQPWTYRFFMDLEGGVGEPVLDDAISTAREQSESIRVIGSYPRWARA